MLPIVTGILGRGRRPGRADAEDHTDVPLIHLFDPFDQRANNFTARLSNQCPGAQFSLWRQRFLAFPKSDAVPHLPLPPL